MACGEILSLYNMLLIIKFSELKFIFRTSKKACGQRWVDINSTVISMTSPFAILGVFVDKFHFFQILLLLEHSVRKH